MFFIVIAKRKNFAIITSYSGKIMSIIGRWNFFVACMQIVNGLRS